MSRLEDLTEEVLTEGRLAPASFEVGRADPVAFWRGEDVGIVFSLVRRTNGDFYGLTSAAHRQPDCSWAATGLTMDTPVSDGLPERPDAGAIDVIAIQSLSFQWAFAGLASAGIDHVVLRSGSGESAFPVFEPLGIFLAVASRPPPGDVLRLTGGTSTQPFTFTVPEDRFPDPAPDAADPEAGLTLVDKVVPPERSEPG
jgi:hypothetical protein